MALKPNNVQKLIANLDEQQMRTVLIKLAQKGEPFVDEITRSAKDELNSVKADDIEEKLCSQIGYLDFDDLNGRASRTSHRYVDPGDAAWELHDEVLQPFLDTLSGYRMAGLKAAEKQMAIGIARGLRRLSKYNPSDIGDYALEWADQWFDEIVKEYRAANSEKDASEFLAQSEIDEDE